MYAIHASAAARHQLRQPLQPQPLLALNREEARSPGRVSCPCVKSPNPGEAQLGEAAPPRERQAWQDWSAVVLIRALRHICEP